MPSKLPFGLYDLLLSRSQRADLDRAHDRNEIRTYLEKLDDEEAPAYLTRHIGRMLLSAFASVGDVRNRIDAQLALCNRIIDVVAEHVSSFSPDDYATSDLLEALLEERQTGLTIASKPIAPHIPLSTSDLLVNDRQQAAIGQQLASEIPSADRIDLIVSFLKKSGLNLLKEQLARRLDDGVPIRVITTSYMGATEPAVLDALEAMGAEVRISYAQRTRLHAKAWLFHRKTGFSTAYIGSSNLSHSAQTLGLEWNVRLSAVDTPHILKKFAAAFEGYWNDETFESYDRERFATALKQYQSDPRSAPRFYDLRPFPFQEEILESLRVAREIHGRTRNLIVAATGTGKTVVAALDYRNLVRKKEVGSPDPTLLFIAHRREILEQAQDVFRTVLKDGSFGERMYDGQRPEKGAHIFASIQSLARQDLAELDPQAFDVVIIDEFHHAEAPTYRRLLDHLVPQQLLGLTATPERADGVNVRDFFGGESTAELRLWDAIDRGLLVPFQYFGLHDNVDISDVKWRRGNYDRAELEERYLEDRHRVDLIRQSLEQQLIDTRRMRALGFCVGVAHAEFMARSFNELGIAAEALTGGSSKASRAEVQAKLRRREINIIFTVDLFNEGIDIPEVDTILFLRPTESATLFLQQLGRGLRLHDEKDCLTVLDFIGRASRDFRFDMRYRSLVGGSRRELASAIATNFPRLPPGCALQLDRQSRELVLESIQSSLQLNRRGLIQELASYNGPISLTRFVRDSGLELEEIYRGGRTWSDIQRGVEGYVVAQAGPSEAGFERGLARLLHIDDPERLDLYARVLGSERGSDLPTTERERRLLAMLFVSLMGPTAIGDLSDSLDRLRSHPAIVAEIRELIEALRHRIRHVPILYREERPIPLKVHCRYSRDEVMTAFDVRNAKGDLMQPREGVYFHDGSRSNLLFVTLRKSEREYSPSTMYRDYALSADAFHWQSQSTTRPDRERGLRHIEHLERGIVPLLFVRESRKTTHGTTQPYMFLGAVSFEKHEGEQPMNVVWRLEHAIPGDLLRVARVA